jgi:hypothetical protein
VQPRGADGRRYHKTEGEVKWIRGSPQEVPLEYQRKEGPRGKKKKRQGLLAYIVQMLRERLEETVRRHILPGIYAMRWVKVREGSKAKLCTFDFVQFWLKNRQISSEASISDVTFPNLCLRAAGRGAPGHVCAPFSILMTSTSAFPLNLSLLA